MSSATPVQSLGEGEYRARQRDQSVSNEYVRLSGNESGVGRRLQNLFGSVVSPYIAAAAFAWPGEMAALQRTFSGVARSRSEIIQIAWDEDDWVLTSEPAAAEEIAALNRLLALPATEGLALDFPDD